MPVVTKTSLPAHSLFQAAAQHYNYQDSYQTMVPDLGNCLTPAAAGKAFFSSAPGWVEALMGIRNKIGAMVGIKVPENLKDRKALLANFTCRPGEQLGLFKVFAGTATEVVLGEDNTHLDFRISVILEPAPANPTLKILTVTTLVKFNNFFGRVYFLPVKPMHKLIVPVMLKGMVRQLEQEKANKKSNYPGAFAENTI